MNEVLNFGTAKIDEPKPAELAPNAKVFDPGAPLDTARRLINDHHTLNGIRLIHRHDNRFWRWRSNHYVEIDTADIRAELYDELAAAMRPDKNGLVPFNPTVTKVNNVLDAYKAAATLPSTITAPTWIQRIPGMPPAEELLPCANGFLHLRDRSLHPTTPLLFIQHALPYQFDDSAPPPARWLRFLEEIWSSEAESIETLQEIFGYLLTNDTSQQKLFLIVGPKRSGKGTITRVLSALLGPESTVAPTLASLSTNFGLAPLIGKRLAVIADARLSGRTDQAVIAERLLSISGEDSMTIDRKYLSVWTGRLSTRFVILTNELPKIADTSGALASRFIVLTLRESFYGKEDHTLSTNLLTELPSILNWSLEGLGRLCARGHFLQPASSDEAAEALEDLGSPLKAFICDCCVVGTGEEVVQAELYNAWTKWCQENGLDRPGTIQTFGRDLRSAVPKLGVRRIRQGAERLRIYKGIRLS